MIPLRFPRAASQLSEAASESGQAALGISAFPNIAVVRSGSPRAARLLVFAIKHKHLPDRKPMIAVEYD